MYDTSVRTPEEEQAWKERMARQQAKMDELDFKEGEHRPETTLDNETMSQVIGLGRR